MFQILNLYKKKQKTVVCYRNSGFGDNLFQAACGWLYAKNAGLNLLINWSNSRYLADKKLNAFFYFFSISNNIEKVEIIKFEKIDLSLRLISINIPNILASISNKLYLKIKPQSTNNIFYKKKTKILGKLSNVEKDTIENNRTPKNKIIYLRGCLYDYSNVLKPFFDAIIPNQEILNLINKFSTENFENKKVIGVHVRYYNKNMVKSDHSTFWQDEDACLQNVASKINQAINQINTSEYVIFLATDSVLPYNYVKNNFKNVVSFQKKFGNNNKIELHDELPQQTAVATIVEMFLLAKSKILVRTPSESWFSHYASLYVENIIS